MTAMPRGAPKGVGGWLLLLCVSLTIFTPLGLLSGASAAINLSDLVKNSYPTFSLIVLLSALPRLLLAIFSVYAGISLWREKSKAVARSRWFLICYAAYFLLNPVTAFIGDLPADFRQQVLNADGVSALRVFVYAVVWHQYLSRSTRVANTYQR